MKKRIIALLLTFVMVLSLVPASIFAADGAEDGHDHEHEVTVTEATSDGAKSASGTTVLAFTSDVHNTGNTSIGTWIGSIESNFGDIDYMGFCGDMANGNNATASTYWSNTSSVMTTVESKVDAVCYTTGNHEYSPGDYVYDNHTSTTNSAVGSKFTVDAAPSNIPSGANYQIYCLGSASGDQAYTDDQVTSLTNYLNGADSSKPIFVLSHYPLHSAGGRTTNNASAVINALNTAVDNGKTIVFLWGHNHTVSDSNYSQIFTPGSSSFSNFKFYYAAAGCMKNGDSITGKGLVATISNNSKATGSTVTLTVVNSSGAQLSSSNTTATITINASASTGNTYTLTDTLEAGNEYLIATANNGSAYILSIEDGSVSGSLKGYSVTVTDGKITLDDTVPEANVAFSCELDPAGTDEYSTWLNIGDQCLYMASQSNLSMATPVSGKYWHYIANDGTTDKNLLWFFQDSKDTTTGTHGYTWTGGTYRYYLVYDETTGDFTKGTQDSSTTSLANTNTDKVYLFVKSGSSDPVDATGVSIDTTNAPFSVTKGGTLQLSAAVTPAGANNYTKTWSSSSDAIATVSPTGKVTGVAEGTATIMVTVTNNTREAFTDSVTVTVTGLPRYELVSTLENGGEYLIVSANAGSAYALKNPGTSGTGIANSSYKTSVEIQSGSPSYIEIEDTDIVWTAEASGSGFHLSNNSLYLEGKSGSTSVYSTLNNADRAWTYSSSNQLQMPGGTSNGQATTYTLRYRNETYYNRFEGASSTSSNSYTVYLFKKLTERIDVTGVSVSPETKTIVVGEETVLTASVTPEDATNKTVTWSSSNTDIATVDSTGKVTGKAAGEVTITATTADGGYTASCIVTVNTVSVTGVTIDQESAIVEIGKTTQLTDTITPDNATNKNVTWNSSNTNIATVDQTGKVTGVAEGNVTITVTTEDGGKTDTCSVTVIAPVVRPGYVIVIDGYAMKAEAEPDTVYHPESSDTNKYYGLKGVEYTDALAAAPTDDILWVLTSVEGKTNTYYIQSMDGKYLNATYKDTSPYEGRLRLDSDESMKDEWVLDGTLEDWVVSGSYLQSTNASTSSKELCLAYETVGPNSTSIHLFTVRSRSNADSSYVESPDIEADVRYEETNAFSDGKEYLIAVTKTENQSLYVLTNNNNSIASTTITTPENNASEGYYPVSGGTDYVITNASGVNWKYTSSNQYLVNNGRYLRGSWTGLSTSNSSGYAATYSNSSGALSFRQSSYSTAYNITCSSSGSFGASSSSAAVVRLFEKKVVVKYTIKWVDASGNILEEDLLEKGVTPEFNGETPTKAEDENYTYSFIGWSPEVTAVTGLAVYTAQFEAVPKPTHTHTFGNPVFNWVEVTEGETVTGYTCATATFTCIDPDCDQSEGYTFNVDVTTFTHTTTTEPSCTGTGVETYNASFTYNEQDYSDSKTVTLPATGHDWQAPTWLFAEDYTSATATFVCANDETHPESVTDDELQEMEVTQPGCETNKVVKYKAIVEFNGEPYTGYSNNVELPNTATGHNWDVNNIDWDWATDYSSCVAHLTCRNNASHKTDMTAEVDSVVNDLVTQYTASIVIEEVTYTNTKDVTHVHTYGDPVYSWTEGDGGYACTATRTCTSCANGTTGRVITVNATVGYAVTTEPTCTATGVGTYTATFEGDEYETQTKEVEIPLAAHTLVAHAATNPTCWTEGNSAYWECSVCHKYFSDANGENEIEADSWVIPRETHVYGGPDWIWAEDYSTATAKFTCTKCNHLHYISDNGPQEIEVSPATCTSDRVVKYTAIVTFEGNPYTNTTDNVTLTGTMLPHNWDLTDIDWQWSTDYSTCAAVLSCSECGTTETRTTDVSTQTGANSTTYIASIVIDGVTYTNSVEICTIKFYKNEGDTEVYATITKKAGEAIADADKPDDPTKAFYTFNSWSPAIPTTMPSGGLVITAQWTAIEGYYLIGSMTEWHVVEGNILTVNPDNSGEYSIGTTLAVGDEIKIVRAVGGVADTANYYPSVQHGDYGKTDNYVVDADHAGGVTLYFRPAGNSDSYWQPFGGYFYIAKDHSIAVQNDGHGTAAAYRSDSTDPATNAPVGKPITVEVTPDTGYELDRIELWKTNGGTAAEQTLENGVVEFNMPDYDLTIKVYFRQTHEHDGVHFIPWTSTTSLPTEAGSYYLTTDVVLSSGWTVLNGEVVNLCLNGHTITQTAYFYVINIPQGKTLNLYDCGTGGAITGGHSSPGQNILVGGVNVEGTFNMYGGSITGNHGASYGGVIVKSEDSVFNMYAGTISDNKAHEGNTTSSSGYGGGVEVYFGTFNLYGGEISGNRSRIGGGVDVYYGVFNMYDGTISGNKTTYGGGGVENLIGTFNMYGGSILGNNSWGTYAGGVYGNLNVSGKVIIKDNTSKAGSDQTTANVHLGNGKIISIIGELDDASQIGVTTETAPTCVSPVIITTGLSGNGSADIFTSDNGYTVGLTTAGEAQLTADHVWDTENVTWVWADDYSSAMATFVCSNDATHTQSVTDENPEREGNAFTATVTFEGQPYTDTQTAHYHDGKFFKAWTATDSLPTEPGSYYLTADVTLTSAWDVPSGTVNLCLNGHSISVGTSYTDYIKIEDGSTLNLYDCAATPGTMTGSGLAIVQIYAGGTFNMYGGAVTGGQLTAVNANGSFHMYGGSITGNGVGVISTGSTYVSGSAVISNNSNGNVVLNGPSGKIIVEGELTDDALIGVYLNGESATDPIVVTCDGDPYVFTSGLSGKGGLSNFTSDNGYSFRINDDGEAEAYKEHTFADPDTITYSWADDNSTCTASHTCAACGQVIIIETVNSTNVVTAPTCTEDGYTTYSADFTDAALEDQSKEVPGDSATGHAYGEPTYVWSGDHSTCTATRVCTHNSEHTETEVANSTYAVTDPTCTEAGYTTYTAAFENEAFGTKTEVVPGEAATGHTYGAPTWSWTGSDDEGWTAATATFTCTKCVEGTDGHSVTMDATVERTDGEDTYVGYDIYTASVTFEGEPYTDVKRVIKKVTVSFNMMGHGEQIPSQTLTYGQTATKPADPSEEGWVFDWYYTDPDFTTSFSFNGEITQDTVLYVKWTAKPTATITIADTETTYNGESQRPTVTVSAAGNTYDWSNPWKFRVKYYSDEVCTEDGFLGYDPQYQNQPGVPDDGPFFRPTDAGTYYVKVDVEGTNTYYGNSAVVEFTIAKRSITIKPTDVTAVYDGQRHSSPRYEISEGTLPDGHNVSRYGSDSNRIDVGTTTYRYSLAKITNYNVEGGADVTANYDITFADGTVTITPAPLTITAVAKTYIYNGEAQGPAGTYTSGFGTYVTLSAEGLVGGDTLKSITIAGSKTDAGVYENGIVPSGAAFNYNHTVSDENIQNYSITYNAATLTISKATTNSATVTLEGWTYGDTPNTPVTAATFGADTATYTYSTTEDGEYTAAVPSAPGTYYVMATIAETGNYAGATATASFTISKTDQEVPQVGHTDETVSGKNDGTITGLTTAMEYSTDGENWTAITEDMLTDGALTGLEPGTYLVRYAETGTGSASEATTVTIAASSNMLTVTWKNWNGETLGTTSVAYSAVPEYTGETPAKAADEDYTYTFDSWTPAITAATADTVYTAVFTPTAQVYNFSEFVWSEDSTSATATLTAAVGGFTKFVAATVTSVTTDPTCGKAGKIVYTATIVVNGETKTEDKEVAIPATGNHTWGAPDYVWSEGNSSVTATAVCSVCDETVTETVSTTYAVTTEPSGTTDGVGTYTATFTKAPFTTQTKEIVIPATGVTVSGTVISFLGSDESDEAKKVTLTLTIGDAEEPAYTTTVNETNGTYTFLGVATGITYTMTVSKQSHVTRTYQMAVAADGTATITEDGAEATEVKIHLRGDTTGDGKVNVIDVSDINYYVKYHRSTNPEYTQYLLTGYALKCADIDGNGTINVIDVTYANSHARRTELLW